MKTTTLKTNEQGVKGLIIGEQMISSPQRKHLEY
jgi:hypothetical protein